MKMYVGDLDYGVTEDALKAAFSEFGEVTGVNIVKDRFSGLSKGFGFIEMPNNSEADKAIKALNGSLLEERRIKISQAKPRERRPHRRPY
ncbi:MAG: RNA-binding protein [Woeseiaceae bacterium]